MLGWVHGAHSLQGLRIPLTREFGSFWGTEGHGAEVGKGAAPLEVPPPSCHNQVCLTCSLLPPTAKLTPVRSSLQSKSGWAAPWVQGRALLHDSSLVSGYLVEYIQLKKLCYLGWEKAFCQWIYIGTKAWMLSLCAYLSMPHGKEAGL